MTQHEILELTSAIEPFSNTLHAYAHQPFRSLGIDTLQINVGRRCNLTCRHCHAEAGPHRTEVMSKATLQKCLSVVKESGIKTIDITGGAPEMNPFLEWFIAEASEIAPRLIVRSNLAILLEPGYEQFPDIYKYYNVEIMASLPDTKPEKTDRQRGNGSFYKILESLRMLNSLGFGLEGSGRVLNLVHNPVGAFLPGPQNALERHYRARLLDDHGIRFNRLLCLTNNPIGRYLEYLLEGGNFKSYMHALFRAFNPSAPQNAMCRTMLSVGMEGTLYDCDFNQMLGLAINHGADKMIDCFDAGKLGEREIVVGNHCYACTAGEGSSCGGTLANSKE